MQIMINKFYHNLDTKKDCFIYNWSCYYIKTTTPIIIQQRISYYILRWRNMETLKNDKYILEVIGITKKFGGITALDNITMKIKKGEVRSLIGENGAGKSTLCNVITGILNPDEGKIIFDGKEVRFANPKEALYAGIRMVYQERNIINYFTGAQSILLGMEETKWKFFIDEKKILRNAIKIMEKIGAEIPLDINATFLSPGNQQMIEILRAVAKEPKILILDEPTASLGRKEIDLLFRVINNLKLSGVAIVIITHKLDEAYEISDKITVLRNGKEVITESSKKLDRKSTIKYMLGKDLKTQYPLIKHSFTDENILKVENLSDSGGVFSDINLYVRKGEVVGLYGLVGAGRTEIVQTIYGIRPKLKGKVFFEGKEINESYNPYNMIKSGFYLIPEDRRRNALFYDFFKLKENLTIGSLDKLVFLSVLINLNKENKKAEEIASMSSLRIIHRDLSQDISELSGGNQQRVSIGRWISQKQMKFLIMDEPTQGIDIGAKHDIYILVRALAKDGIGILIISSELPELTGICDRLCIVRGGKIIAIKNYEEFDDHEIMEMVL